MRSIADGVEIKGKLGAHLKDLYDKNPTAFLDRILRREDAAEKKRLEHLKDQLARAKETVADLDKKCHDLASQVAAATGHGPLSDEECVKLAEKWLVENVEQA
jgi:hypothetical protein